MDTVALQQKVKDFAQVDSIDHAVETGVLDLVSEVGEVAKEILKNE
jgi:NTP pyrophosphatase (non-canonical NTP hydrolase)